MFGPAHDDVESYLQCAGVGRARARPALPPGVGHLPVVVRRPAVAYEYFFFGDPVRMAGALVASYDREPLKRRVREFLERDDVRQIAGGTND